MPIVCIATRFVESKLLLAVEAFTDDALIEHIPPDVDEEVAEERGIVTDLKEITEIEGDGISELPDTGNLDPISGKFLEDGVIDVLRFSRARHAVTQDVGAFALAFDLKGDRFERLGDVEDVEPFVDQLGLYPELVFFVGGFPIQAFGDHEMVV